MNISTFELQELRRVLSKKDKEDIAQQVGKSFRLVTAVLQGDRTNDEVEQLILDTARSNTYKLLKTLNIINSRNQTLKLNYKQYKSFKESMPRTGEEYCKFMDIYLQLVNINFFNTREIILYLKSNFVDFYYKNCWTAYLLERLLGVHEKEAYKEYNKSLPKS
ncbi:MAG: hypothetical protein N4A49_01715 [Marinifilaceae bacterium]|jgi:hypothetical protein|nr:hypothetical protein [Marinifilaceae bacterium]